MQIAHDYLYSLLTMRREKELHNVQLYSACTVHQCSQVGRPLNHAVPSPISTMKEEYQVFLSKKRTHHTKLHENNYPCTELVLYAAGLR